MSYTTRKRRIRTARSGSAAAALPLWDGRASSMFFLFAALFILLISNFYPSLVTQTRMKIADTTAPLLSAISAPFQLMAEASGQVTGLTDLRLENERLAIENGRLRQWYQAAQQLQAENQSLEKLLHVKVDPMYGFVTARVMSDSGGVFAKSVMIKAGQSDGVKDGQAALSGEGLIGRVMGIGKHSARILLLNDLNSRIPVIVENSGQRAILAGTNETLPILTRLPEGSEIQEGVRIVTSGHGGVFPAGLPIGRIIVDKHSQYRVKLFADIDTIRFVRVVDSEENYITDNIGRMQ